MFIIFTGIAGAGKTTVGKLLAEQLGWRFYEGDDFHPAANVEKMRLAFASRAEVINKRLNAVPPPGMPCAKATGAFYAFPKVSAYFGKTTPGGRTIDSAMSFCEALLEESLVAFVPGEDFGGCGKEHVRISFACNEDQINKGMDRLEKFLASLK